jgi:hypothetical protein
MEQRCCGYHFVSGQECFVDSALAEMVEKEYSSCSRFDGDSDCSADSDADPVWMAEPV